MKKIQILILIKLMVVGSLIGQCGDMSLSDDLVPLEIGQSKVYKFSHGDYLSYDTVKIESEFEFEGKVYSVLHQDVSNRILLWVEDSIIYKANYFGGINKIINQNIVGACFSNTDNIVLEYDSIVRVKIDSAITFNNCSFHDLHVYDIYNLNNDSPYKRVFFKPYFGIIREEMVCEDHHDIYTLINKF